MEISQKTEFPEERKGVITQLESLAWHCNNLLCPYCMEKHSSLVNGLSSEIADGKEGDEEAYRQLSEEASKVIDRLQKNKAVHAFSDEDINFYRDWARGWRRKLSGATGTSHNHSHKVEVAEEEFEHPWATEEQAEQIVKEHYQVNPEEEELFKRCIQSGETVKFCRANV